jgi:tetratricopeptide (TPR) repeat protein
MSDDGVVRQRRSHHDDVRIVLSMIVRDEAAVVGRCLSSVLPHVDGFVIADTGSTDATVAVIESVAATSGASGVVVSHEWHDFGHNRTLALEATREWVRAQGWEESCTYALLVDADMVLGVDQAFDPDELTASSYQVVQDDGTLRYWNTRLVRLSHDWCAVGSTHEYWATIGDEGTTERLTSLWIDDRGDGGSKADKARRDLALLHAEVSANPDDARATYYLANTYYDAGHHSEAARWYAHRLDLGGWDEERWHARYRHGLCLFQLGETSRAVAVMLEAYDMRPTRAETLAVLARHHREQGLNQVAWLFAQRGLDLPFPDDDVLFVERPVYEWQLWQEVMICAYYLGAEHQARGLDACERLLGQRGHEPWFYNYVAANEVFYLSPLETTRRGVLTVPEPLRRHDDVVYHELNPTIVSWRGTVRLNIRLVNYWHDAGRHYLSLSPDGVFRTHNVSYDWDPGTALEGEAGRLLRRDVPEAWLDDSTRGLGLEDVRWVVHDDRVWLTATCYQVPHAKNASRVVLGRMNEQLDATDHVVALEYADVQEMEKNWVPWSVGGELRVIYGYDPFVVLHVDPATGATEVTHKSDPPVRLSGCRGSAGPVPVPGHAGRYLVMVHEVAFRNEGRAYWHRWLVVDEHDGIVGWSDPFVFDHIGIEYATGLVTLDDEHLIVTYGYEDTEARWLECRWDDVLASVHGEVYQEAHDG